MNHPNGKADLLRIFKTLPKEAAFIEIIPGWASPVPWIRASIPPSCEVPEGWALSPFRKSQYPEGWVRVAWKG